VLRRGNEHFTKADNQSDNSLTDNEEEESNDDDPHLPQSLNIRRSKMDFDLDKRERSNIADSFRYSFVSKYKGRNAASPSPNGKGNPLSFKNQLQINMF
jgi:hypothetical protein